MSVDLRSLFLHLQRQLAGKLETARKVIDHPGIKGGTAEAGWIGMLEEYLPKRYCVASGFVIDSDGGQSRQLDLVLYDRQYSPFLFNQDGALFVPAESVYAVFEVKQDLSKEHIVDASEKAASVRNLHRTSVGITHAGGRFEPRPPIPILAGLVCLGSRWSPAFGDPLVSSLGDLAAAGRLDLICSLQHGACEVVYSENGQPRLEKSAFDTALIFFFLRLLERLQCVGTVPAIDLRRYGRSLEMEG